MIDSTHPGAERGRPELFHELVDTYALKVYRYLASSVGSELCAEDLTQETYLRAYRKLDTLREPEKARPWLFAIAANMVREDARRRSRRPADPLDRSSNREEVGGDPRAKSERGQDVRMALARMKEEDRTVLLLIGQVGLSSSEVAAVLGIRPDAARKRWQRACVRFRDAFDRNGDER